MISRDGGQGSLTDVPGFSVGHATDFDALTGCTVVLCPRGTIGGVDVRGGAPGTRETDLLRPMYRIEQVNAVLLSGGSAYGLAAADGVMRYLAERGEGYRTRSGHFIPIVPTAILFDLAIGRGDVWPDAAMGYAACEAASTDMVEQGCIGAGVGCRIGAMRGNAFATKGGIGTASIELPDGLVVAALCAVNAVGDVIDDNGRILGGLRRPPDGDHFEGMIEALREHPTEISVPSAPAEGSGENTVIGVVATNARLRKDEVNKVAQMAHDGVARAVRPSHTPFDGDTIFALASGAVTADPMIVGTFAAEVTAEAIRNGVRHAVSLGGVRAWRD